MKTQSVQAEHVNMLANIMCVLAGIATLAIFLYMAYFYETALMLFFGNKWYASVFALAPLLALLFQPKAQKSWTSDAEQRYRKYKILFAVARTAAAWGMMTLLGGVAVLLVALSHQEEPSAVAMIGSMIGGILLVFGGIGTGVMAGRVGKEAVDHSKFG